MPRGPPAAECQKKTHPGGCVLSLSGGRLQVLRPVVFAVVIEDGVLAVFGIVWNAVILQERDQQPEGAQPVAGYVGVREKETPVYGRRRALGGVRPQGLLQLRVWDVDTPLNPLIKESVKNNTFIEQDF